MDGPKSAPGRRDENAAFPPKTGRFRRSHATEPPNARYPDATTPHVVVTSFLNHAQENQPCPKKATTTAKPPFGDPSDPQGLAPLCPAFLEWMRIKNYSENTVARPAALPAALRLLVPGSRHHAAGRSHQGHARTLPALAVPLPQGQRQALTFRSQFAFTRARAGLLQVAAPRRTTPSTTRPANSTCPSWRNACPSTS